VGRGVAGLVGGTAPGRRTAMQLVARGASDYFALPDDLEIFRTAVAAAVSGARARGAAPPSGAGREDAFATIVGESDTIKTVLARAARLLPHRNATCHWACRPSCCARWRTKRSGASGAQNRELWTSALWRRRTPRSRPACGRGPSGRTSSSA